MTEEDKKKLDDLVAEVVADTEKRWIELVDGMKRAWQEAIEKLKTKP